MGMISCGGGEEVKKPGEDTTKKAELASNSRESILKKIAALEGEAKAAGAVNAEKALTQRLITAYNEYVMYYPTDSVSGDFAFRSAMVAINTFNNDQAIVLIDNYLKNYPGDRGRKMELLLLKGMIYDDRMNADDRAKLVYEEIIKEFPNTPAAQQAADAMKLLGKSDMDLIKEFEKKNKVNS